MADHYNSMLINSEYHSDEFQHLSLLQYISETEATDELNLLSSLLTNNIIEEDMRYFSLFQIALLTASALTIEEEFTKYFTSDFNRAAYSKVINYNIRKREQIAILVYYTQQEDNNED